MKLASVLLSLTVLSSPALAGDLALVSMHHSSDHFVPHLRFDGFIETGDAEALADMLTRVARCTESCDGATAVLSFNSPGGSFIEAQAIAEVLKRERVGTVVDADSACFSACLVAFTGGTARRGEELVADRIVVPGAAIMIYPLRSQHEALSGRILARGLESVLGAPLTTLEPMAEDGSIGLDRLFAEDFVPTGSVGIEDLSAPTYLRLLEATLPPGKSSELMPDVEAGLLQACASGLTEYYALRDGKVNIVPWDATMYVDPAFQDDLGSIGHSGYRIDDTEVSFCAGELTEREGDRVWMFGPGEAGTVELIGVDIKPHMLFPPGIPVSRLEAFYRPFVNRWTFRSDNTAPHYPSLVDANLPAELGFVPQVATLYSRISAYGDLQVIEQIGDDGLGEGLSRYLEGPALVDQQVETARGASIIRASHADSGKAVFIAAFDDRMQEWVGRIELDRPWSEVSTAEEADLGRWACNIKSITERLTCD